MDLNDKMKYQRKKWQLISVTIFIIWSLIILFTERLTLLTTTSVRNRKIYNKFELLSIKARVSKFRQLRRLPNETFNNIRTLNIQKRRKRGKREGVAKVNKFLNNQNQNNNIVVAMSEFQSRNFLNFGLVNIQSIRSKSLPLLHILESDTIDLCLVTETWLDSSNNCKAWIEGTELNNDQWRISTQNRSVKRGGGSALIYNNKKFKVLKLNGKCGDNFEFALWKVSNIHSSIVILGIYRPPTRNFDTDQNTLQTFLIEFTKFHNDISAEHNDIIIAGDFNIHVNSEIDNDADQFLNMLETLGLLQHIHFATHNKGNILDLIITEQFSKINISDCQPIDLISDHQFISAKIKFQVDKIKTEVKRHRSFKYTNMDSLIEDIDLDLIYESDDKSLDELVELFSEQCNKALDIHAPWKNSKIKTDHRKPWFNDHLLNLRRDYRRSLKHWIKIEIKIA